MKRLEKVPRKHRKDVAGKLLQLAASLQARREELGLTQEQLAEKLNIHEVTLRTIESGRRYPSLPMLFHISAILGLQIQVKG